MEKRSPRPKAFSSSTSNLLAVMDGDGCKRSASEVDMSRGFIPSDMKDPNKKKILDDLTKKIFLSSDEEKLRKKQVKQRPTRPKYFYERNGSQFVNVTAPTPPPNLPESKELRSHDRKRHPNQMYTDSSVYHPKHHPSVAEQVKMAHQLSSSLFADANKESQGQEMFFKRVQTDPQSSKTGIKLHPHRAPNMKLVMNPDGKLHDWTELPKEEVSELARVVSNHFSQTENVNHRNGGENYSSYKDIFESRRNIFSNIMDNASNMSISSSHWNSHNINNNNNSNSNNNRNMNLNQLNRTKKGSYVSNQNYIQRHSQQHQHKQQQQPLPSSSHFPQSYDLLRSKTAPSLAGTPKLPTRGSSKYAMANYENRPNLEKFFV